MHMYHMFLMKSSLRIINRITILLYGKVKILSRQTIQILFHGCHFSYESFCNSLKLQSPYSRKKQLRKFYRKNSLQSGIICNQLLKQPRLRLLTIPTLQEEQLTKLWISFCDFRKSNVLAVEVVSDTGKKHNSGCILQVN